MPDGTDPKKFKKATVNAANNNNAVKNMLPLISNQFDQTRSYVNSPMYAQRLARMVATEKQLTGDASRFSSEVLGGFKPIQPINSIVQGVVANNNQNLNNVSDKISVGNYNLGTNVAGGYDSGMNDVRFNQELLSKNPTVPAHEFSHATNDGLAPYSQQYKEKFVDKIMVQPGNSVWSPEVQKPTEVKARLDAIRSLAQKQGIYDASKEVFGIEHLNKLKNSKEFKNDFNFQQIREQLSKDYKDNGFIWLMNNIAKNKTDLLNNA